MQSPVAPRMSISDLIVAFFPAFLIGAWKRSTEMNCQIVLDCWHGRGRTDWYLLRLQNRVVGYGLVGGVRAEQKVIVTQYGVVAATGGILCHYNVPYGDIFMGVAEPFRRRGYGSYLIQELKRVCYERGRIPAARCNASNVASRATLQKAGLLPCARFSLAFFRPDPRRTRPHKSMLRQRTHSSPIAKPETLHRLADRGFRACGRGGLRCSGDGPRPASRGFDRRSVDFGRREGESTRSPKGVSMVEQRKVVTAAPENSETPLESVRSWVTPTRLFFVRNHFAVPDARPRRVAIDRRGLRQRARTWTWDELMDLAGAHRLRHRRMCRQRPLVSGGARSPACSGVPAPSATPSGPACRSSSCWSAPACEPDAVEVLFEGADVGTEHDHPAPMPFERSLPLAKALHPDTLLVSRMNGELLEPEHGYPLRLFVPGWYGVASVKWLRRIEVREQAVSRLLPVRQVHDPAQDRARRRNRGRRADDAEVGDHPPASPATCSGSEPTVSSAWPGPARIRSAASRSAPTAAIPGTTPRSWDRRPLIPGRCGSISWEAGSPGEHTILARATSSSGRVQPSEHDPLNGGYLIHHSRPLSLRVVAFGPARRADSTAQTIMYDMNAYAEENMRMPLDVEMEFCGGEGI